MGGFGKFMERYQMKKWFQKDNLIILVLAGILLIVIALPTKDADSDSTGSQYAAGTEERGNSLWAGSSESSADGEISRKIAGDGIYVSDYAAYLEEKLAGILSKIKGAGKVYVMITLQESEELVVEKDFLQSDSDSGSQTQEETIYETDGSLEIPYVIKTIFPKVEGVVVIAEGAGTGTVTKTITEIVQALFDIEIHKIKVAGSIIESN